MRSSLQGHAPGSTKTFGTSTSLSCTSLLSPWCSKNFKIRLPGRQPTQIRAEQKPGQSEEERRLEALEASIRGKKPPTPIKIRNSVEDERAREDKNSNFSPWPEGQLLPLGWENMNGYQKTVELLYGRRGLLFWINKIAYTSVFVLIGAWILFRFVGPGIGLYNLEGNFAPPPI